MGAGSHAFGQKELRVAAAADLQPVMPVLSQAYEKATGVKLIVSFGSFVPGAWLITLLDDLWMLWDRQRQTLHDKVAGTIVVRR